VSTGDLLVRIEHAVAAGVDWVQIREKDLPARDLLALTQRAICAAKNKLKATSNIRTRVVVNDRLDVAIAADAAGVHLGGSSLPIGEVVRWCRAGNAPKDFLIGASCHTIQEAVAAEGAGANYIFFGPVYETPSKENLGAPQGIEKLAEVCEKIRMPVLAIGGIGEGNAAVCMSAGAAGIAAIRLFQQSLNATSLGDTLSRLRAIRPGATQ
ncbi:MAG TPA: thiamine phosphate synthase, partial [Candidatus Acidoferrales bacterium]|nr:thiamine phosphate synthase [Candidatus Acidoferrales bacterium]